VIHSNVEMHVDKAVLPGSPAPRATLPLEVVVDGGAGADVVVVGDVVVRDVVMRDVVVVVELEEVRELRGIDEVPGSPTPAYLTAGDSCANPMEGGSYL